MDTFRYVIKSYGSYIATLLMVGWIALGLLDTKVLKRILRLLVGVVILLIFLLDVVLL